MSRGWLQKWLAFLAQGSGVKAGAVSYFVESMFTFFWDKCIRRAFWKGTGVKGVKIKDCHVVPDEMDGFPF